MTDQPDEKQLSDIQTEFTNVMRAEILRHARAAVAFVTCPVHGPAAKEVHVVLEEGSENASITVTACCPSMDAEIDAALATMEDEESDDDEGEAPEEE